MTSPDSTAEVSVLYKILQKAAWTEALAQGQFRGAAIDLTDGYIHFSTLAQVRETASKHFAGQSDLLLLAIDRAALEAVDPSRLRFEPSRGGALFPHWYGAMPLDVVRWVKDLPVGQEPGTFEFPSPLPG